MNNSRHAITKFAQALIHHAPTRTPATFEAYPDYSKSLLHQRKKNPVSAGVTRAVGTGITGAALGALIARVLTTNRGALAAGAAAGGAIGGMAGYRSGKNEAESEYSKLLFLRRRLGLNEPGEYEALAKHPALISQMIDRPKNVKSAALSPEKMKALRVALGAGVGGAAGWGLGTEGMSRVMGYHDDPGARHMGGAINAANLAVIGGLMGHSPATLGKFMHEHFAAPASMVGMELLPSAKQTFSELSSAGREQAQNQIVPAIGERLNSPAGRGAGAGVGLAGLAALVTGMSRGRSEKEIGRDTSRPGMVAKDFSKFVLPAALAGSVIGSLRHTDRQ